MKFYNVINCVKANGEIDYKGLDISQFKFESQFYDLANKVCVLATTQMNYKGHTDVIELNEAKYNEMVDIIKTKDHQNSTSEQEKINAENAAKIQSLEENQATLLLELAMLKGGTV